MGTYKVTEEVETLIARGMTVEQITAKVDPRYKLWDSYHEAYVVNNRGAEARLMNLLCSTEPAAPRPAATATAAPLPATDKQVDYALILIGRAVRTGAHGPDVDHTKDDLRAMTRGRISDLIDLLKEQY